MDLNEKLLKTIEDTLDDKGVTIEISKLFKERFINLSEEIAKDNVRKYLQADYVDSNMFLYTFVKMLKNNQIDITFKENANQKDIEYLKRLSEGF